MKIIVTGLNRVADPRPNKKGDTVMAHLDFTADFLTVKGAVLVRLASGGWTVWEPLWHDPNAPRRPVKISGEARKAIMQAAMPFFEAMGGNLEGRATECAR